MGGGFWYSVGCKCIRAMSTELPGIYCPRSLMTLLDLHTDVGDTLKHRFLQQQHHLIPWQQHHLMVGHYFGHSAQDGDYFNVL